MPKRRTYTRYVTRTRRAARRVGGIGGGLVGNVLAGIVAGAAGRFTAGIHPLAPAATTAGVGWFMKNPTLQTIGGMQLGNALLSGGVTAGSNGGGGWY